MGLTELSGVGRVSGVDRHPILRRRIETRRPGALVALLVLMAACVVLGGRGSVAASGNTPTPRGAGPIPGATAATETLENPPPTTDRPPVMPEVPVEGEASEQSSSETESRASSTFPLEEPVQPTASTADGATTSKPADSPGPGDYYGLWALAPAMVAIILAIATRQVLVALGAGILIAAGMMLGFEGSWSGNPITVVTYAIEHYLFGVLASVDVADGKPPGVDDDHLRILVFTFFIGAMVGVIEANGGTRAMVARVTRRVKTRSRGQLGAFFAGVAVFFDDYANAMIIGPSMRPIFDRLKISREKLAYIVDSTAAPVSSVFIGTWLAAEIGYLDEGLNALGVRPAFIEGMTGNTAFWGSLPYRTYAWLALAMVFILAVTGRDFGSMKTAEAKCLSGDGADSKGACGRGEADASKVGNDAESDGRRWWLGAVPVCTLVATTIGLLFYTGYAACGEAGTALSFGSLAGIGQSIKEMLGAADSYPALLYGALTAACLAVVMSVASRSLSLAGTMDAVMSGMCRMFPACAVLVLAWGLSQGGEDLQLGSVACDFLNEKVAAGVFSPILLPPVVFICAAIVSFSTGTSWGTMGILCPAVVTVSAGLFGGMPADQAMPLFYGSVGAVLTGAVFGDHCSPISDTTVLSSIASECDLTKHVWTQMPYALVVAVVGLLSTDGLDIMLNKWAPEFYEQHWQGRTAYGLAIGVGLLVLIVFAIGRRPRASTRPAGASLRSDMR